MSDGDSVALPCTDRLMNTNVASLLREQGINAVMAHKGEALVRLAGLEAVNGDGLAAGNARPQGQRQPLRGAEQGRPRGCPGLGDLRAGGAKARQATAPCSCSPPMRPTLRHRARPCERRRGRGRGPGRRVELANRQPKRRPRHATRRTTNWPRCWPAWRNRRARGRRPSRDARSTPSSKPCSSRSAEAAGCAARASQAVQRAPDQPRHPAEEQQRQDAQAPVVDAEGQFLAARDLEPQAEGRDPAA
jgi:hypothetical protein